jgi:hypothetical protein
MARGALHVPFWTQTPNNRFATRAIARAWVPMDDEHSMLFDITCGVDAGNPAYTSTLKDGTPLFDTILYAPNTTDWYGRWRSADSQANDWAIDREASAMARSSPASPTSPCRTRP